MLLRNQAADEGASFLVVDSIDVDDGRHKASGRLLVCSGRLEPSIDL